jgi:hypothetical protein
MPTITTAAALRAAFWDAHPSLDMRARQRRTRSKPQNHQDTETRLTWCDWVDAQHRAGLISHRLAYTATL